MLLQSLSTRLPHECTVRIDDVRVAVMEASWLWWPTMGGTCRGRIVTSFVTAWPRREKRLLP